MDHSDHPDQPADERGEPHPTPFAMPPAGSGGQQPADPPSTGAGDPPAGWARPVGEQGDDRPPYPQQPAPPSAPPNPWSDRGDGPSYGQPAYGRPPTGQPTYGQPYDQPTTALAPQQWSGYGPQQPPPGSGTGPRRRAGFVLLAVIVIIVVGLASGAGGAAIALHSRKNGGTSTVRVASPVSSAKTPTQPLAKVAAAVQPSVVSIVVQAGQSGDEGSGVVLDKNGLILTNNHVVAAAAGTGGSVEVTYSNGQKSAATIVGRDTEGDLAVIRAAKVGGTPATFGNSDDLAVGDAVLAIGSPLGLEGSVSSGIVSALHRVVATSESGQQQQGSSSSIDDAIQTDAAVNPGNSGGPLVNTSGEVVGINTAIASVSSGGSGSQSGNIGVGFAIPAAQVQKELPALEQGQQPKRAVLGVEVTDGQNGGALIDSVVSGGAAAAAGLKAGDVITSLGGATISGSDQLGAAVRDHNPGQKVTVSYQRNGAKQTTTVTLGGSG